VHLAHPHLPHPGSVGSHVSVWLHQFELDRRLADGADPDSSPELSMRARLLVGMRFRRHLVVELESVLARAEHPPHWRSASLPVCADAVRAAEDSLRRLAGVLTAQRQPPVRGVALAACLINDPTGPLYDRPRCHRIAPLADEATTALMAPRSYGE
jgi:hypothetical protein